MWRAARRLSALPALAVIIALSIQPLCCCCDHGDDQDGKTSVRGYVKSDEDDDAGHAECLARKCVAPEPGMEIRGLVCLCPGEFSLGNAGLAIRENGSRLVCNDTTLIGEGTGDGISIAAGDCEIRGCKLDNW